MDKSAGQLCRPGALDPVKVNGKIVVCLRGDNPLIEKGKTVRLVGRVGIILCNDLQGDPTIVVTVYGLPSAQLSATDGAAVFGYINSTQSPVASIDDQPTMLNIRPAPVMASLSSKGPNPIIPDILKPDITAPGVNILAAYTEAEVSIPSVPFYIPSGTSMACPMLLVLRLY